MVCYYGANDYSDPSGRGAVSGELCECAGVAGPRAGRTAEQKKARQSLSEAPVYRYRQVDVSAMPSRAGGYGPRAGRELAEFTWYVSLPPPAGLGAVSTG